MTTRIDAGRLAEEYESFEEDEAPFETMRHKRYRNPPPTEHLPEILGDRLCRERERRAEA